MVDDYDKNEFEIVDLYDELMAEYEERRRETEDWKYWDEEDFTPEDYKRDLFGDTKPKTVFILKRYLGCAEEVVIPTGVTSIKNEAFYKNKTVKSVYIPDTVTGIGLGAFMFCESLEKVRLSKNIASIAISVFEHCKSLKSIRLPEGLQKISLSAFANSGLESVYLPAGVNSISSGVFADCVNLRKIEVDPDNQTFYAQDNCIYSRDKKQLVCGFNDGAMTNDGILEEICDSAFTGNLKLEDVDVPQGVKIIENSAFKGCANLRAVALPDTLEAIGALAFEDCGSLKNVIVPKNVKKISRFAFSRCGLLWVVIKRGVETIDDDAFWNCAGLREVFIPSSVKNISSTAFDGCESTLKIYVETGRERNSDKWFYTLSKYFDVTKCEKLDNCD